MTIFVWLKTQIFDTIWDTIWDEGFKKLWLTFVNGAERN